jgi:DNA-binding transcriptional LysR family regulator
MKYQRILSYFDAVARTGSFRKAAERANITGSALVRRIQDLEQELGAPLFERRARGVGLTTAGEMFLAYARAQDAEAQRLASQIEDMRGVRRGAVRISCSQAAAPHLLPQAIARFTEKHPKISFHVEVLDREAAVSALADYRVDLVLVYRPALAAGVLHVLKRLPQKLVALLPEWHALSAGKGPLRLRDCVRYPMALPERPLGARVLLEEFAGRAGIRIAPAVESNSFEMLRGCVRHTGLISFQIEAGVVTTHAKATDGIVARPIDERDAPPADLILGQLRGRNLPVAAASFAEMFAEQLGTF